MLVSVFLVPVNAQIRGAFNHNISWNNIEKYDFYGDTIMRISFDGAYYEVDDEKQTPLIREIIPVFDDNIDVNFDLEVSRSEMLPSEELYLLPDELPSLPELKTQLMTSRDESKLCFTLYPFFKENDTVKRVLSFEVSYSVEQIAKKERKSYVENSVLANGKWYKMSISSAGIHKISYSELSSMGVAVSSINPKNIRIYHNGGGVVPVKNNAFRHQDLVEIPVYVHGENDGSFDENDYILFYARGPVTWEYNDINVYERVLNPYSDFSYAFLTTDLGEGKRIQTSEVIASDADVPVNEFLDYRLVEEDLYNLNNMGATWYFDKFEAQTLRSYSFNFPNIIKEKKGNIYAEVASRNSAVAYFNFKYNDNLLSKLRFNPNNNSATYALTATLNNVKFEPASDNVVIELNYERALSSSVGWLDYIAVNAWRKLTFVNNMMLFRNPECNDAGKVYRYQLNNASNSLQIWDVTNPVEPKKLQLQNNSGTASFKVYGADDNEFIAFNGNEYKTPSFVSVVQNQNIHSKYDFDYLIIAHPDFYSQAQRLKEIHSQIDDLEIEIVTPQQIYNEFSCGALDISAIRDYIKMIYDKTDKRLRYVLLFGDVSYDYRNKSGKVCFVPSYESVRSCSSDCNVSDDFFACLDDDEGNIEMGGVVDIAVGRMPVSTVEQAEDVVDKIEMYVSRDESGMGAWRKMITFATDDGATYYMIQAEQLESIVRTTVGDDVNFDKIYLDAYPQMATSSGQRSPECNAAITNRVELGSLIINYIGHAGEVGWADERILTNEDILSWRNASKLHLMITASCEFSRVDDHTRTSAGEYVFLNPNGGAIAMISAARVTFADNNQKMMKGFYQHLFDMEGGEFITMGDMYYYAKQIGDANSKDYFFLGDPALRINFPKNKIELTAVNNHDIQQLDTLRALQNVKIEGVVKDIDDNVMTDFNGTVVVNVFDKVKNYTTYGDESDVHNFELQNSLIYSGKVPVTNGTFVADFILPKDINYSFGYGLMSFYAYSDKTEAQGSFSQFIVGGLNPDAEIDETGPEIKIYIDDVEFVDGSLTNENPMLIALLKDKNGINTSGAGIGHDITATLSGATNKTYNLNQFYEAPLSLDDYGTLSYKFYNLNEGEHLLTFKAWDIYNNSNSTSIRFNVKKGKIVNIENLYNYPNPVSDYTNFTFEHNQKDNEIDVEIRIYNVMGQLVRTIREHRFGTTVRIEPIIWDATSEQGSKLPAGVYIYNVTVTNSMNEKSSSFSKLIIR